MRQRNVKNVEEKMRTYTCLLVDATESRRGCWREVFSPTGELAAGGEPVRGALVADGEGATERNDAIGGNNAAKEYTGDDTASESDLLTCPLYAELGCGKGRFIVETASADSAGLYIALEGQKSALYRALERAAPAKLPNLRFCFAWILDIRTVFAPNELSGIYLNFSDPWPKSRHEKRRLTAPAYLQGYRDVLEPGGFLQFKTDNGALFAYSLETVAAAEGFTLEGWTDDLANSPYAAGNQMTEYEMRFIALGQKIHFLRARKQGGG